MYTLKTKGTLEFSRPFKTEAELDASIDRWFSRWLGMQPKGSNKTFNDYMEGKEKVKMTIERI